jgi:curved DNA-binding protein CbpA
MAKERLTEDRKSQLEELYNSLHQHNFYTVLGVEEEADRTSLRKAYFSISKLCHPDNYAEKDLGPYRTYMEKIFQACSKAYDVLGNASKRQRYDAYLEKKKSTAQYASSMTNSEVSLHRAIEEAAQKPPEVDEEIRRAGPPPVQVPEEPPSPKPSPRPSRPPSIPPDPITSSVPPAQLDDAARKRHSRRRRAWTRDSARRRLLGAVGNVKAASTTRQATTWLSRARKAYEDGETVPALNAVKMALSIEPENGEAKAMLDEMMEAASGELGQRYYEQAVAEMEFGESHLAVVSIEKAVNLSPDTPLYTAFAAHVLLETDGDMHRAYELAQKAALSEPKSGAHQLLLGKILLKAGLQARARSALGKALELNPKLREAKGLLAGL